jgi:MFS-type transporter involved in bile tolerance (Atg22 family)
MAKRNHERQPHEALDKVFEDTEVASEFVVRRIQSRFLIGLGMLAAGIAAPAIGILLVRIGLLTETNSQLAMTAVFFAVAIGGAWAYDRGWLRG